MSLTKAFEDTFQFSTWWIMEFPFLKVVLWLVAFAIWWHSVRVNRKENLRIYITIVNKNLGSGSDLTMHNNNATCWIYSKLFGWLLLVTCDSWRSRRLSPITQDCLHCLLLCCLQRPSLWQILPALCLLLSLVPMSDVTGEGTKGGHEPVHAFPVDV